MNSSEIISLSKKFKNVDADYRMNLFCISGKYHLELPHSNIISYLLNRDGSHTDENYCNYFISMLNKKLTAGERLPEKLRWDVYRERENIDILLINDSEKRVVIIENKIHAGDQYRQLERYNEIYAKRNYSVQLVYLSLWGYPPGKGSLGKLDAEKVICISYENDIKSWLELCKENSDKKSENYFGLKQYLESILLMTSEQEKKRKITEEVFEKEGVNFNDLGHINKAGTRYCHYIFLQKLIKLLKTSDKNLQIEESSKDNIMHDEEYYIFISLNDKAKFAIGFENNDRSKTDFGIGLYNKDLEKDKDLVKLFASSKKYKKWTFKDNEYWYIWAYSAEIDDLGSYRNYNNNEIAEWEQWADEAEPIIFKEYQEIKEFINKNLK